MPEILEKIYCVHCGDPCDSNSVTLNEKTFCCQGCKLVYEIINDNDLCPYYDLNANPGIKVNAVNKERYAYLDEKSISAKLILHQNEKTVSVLFSIPAMHCSSCIWLLENLKKLNQGVQDSKVNFINKEVFVVFEKDKITIRQLVELLASTGYEPEIHLASDDKQKKKKKSNGRIIRIGIAGFCFGNIMMLSFPEYFSSGTYIDPGLKQFFSYMILLLSLPVFFYSASEFFINSFRSLRFKSTNIDVPIAIGITAIFIRSSYEIISGTGAGFFDSGSGLIFFMLIGRWFQDFTFDSLAFERNYRSYFPIAVTLLKDGIERSVYVNDLEINDRIIIHNNEIIPADCILQSGEAQIDYSFVSGESLPVHVHQGETIFAGGKQTGTVIGLKVTKKVSQSQLVSLWNNQNKKNDISGFDKMVGAISRYFIVVTFTIAFFSGAYWWTEDHQKAVNAFTAVLVIACPCALALSAPFTYGNILRILGKRKIYLRNYKVAEQLSDIDTIVFDKTGTLTSTATAKITFNGTALSDEEKITIYSLVKNSVHPLSIQLAQFLNCNKFYSVNDFTELSGLGISGCINGRIIKVGSSKFIYGLPDSGSVNATKVYVSINNSYKGYFTFSNVYRSDLPELITELISSKKKLLVLSGDGNSERSILEKLFPSGTEIKFNCSAADKKNEIVRLKQEGKKVLMIGDGLNDAGALMSSDVGISLTENINNFTPASDVIMHAGQFGGLSRLIRFSKVAKKIIIWSFIISLLYNFVGLSFAVTGTLSPLIAAILMPISTISLVLFTVAASTIASGRSGFR